MPRLDKNTRTIIARLKRDGWLSEGGSKHDKFGHPDRPGIKIIVPRHKEQSPGVARSIAEAAGWDRKG